MTYDIVDDSIIIVRSGQDSVKAYHNACPHRGRRLTEGTGNVKQFVCAFHGWRYDLDGKNIKVIDKKDWGGCLAAGDIQLSPVQCDTWAGFAFINMDPKAEPLADFLAPVPEYCDKFEFEKLRFRWYKTAVMPANWKTVLGFFNEFYHVQQAHQQLLEFTNDYSQSGGFGRHGQVWYDAEGAVPFKRSPRLPPRPEPPLRQHLTDFAENYNRDLRAMLSERNYAAVQKLREEMSDDTPGEQVMTRWIELQIEAATADGAGWPAGLTAEYVEKSGLDWHVFPNTIFLHGLVDSVLWYRVRPNGHDPESCIFDVWSLERYGPGKAPPLQREFYTDWRQGDWGLIYEQDFINIPEVQKGRKSRGFKGERTNPVQERAISSFHRELRRFMHDPLRQAEARAAAMSTPNAEMRDTRYDKYKLLKFDRRGRILTITMDNPPLNAADVLLHDELSYVFDDVAADNDCDVIVLTGAGRAFSAGGDFNGLLRAIEDSALRLRMMSRTAPLVTSILGLDKPTIARVNGHAMAWGPH